MRGTQCTFRNRRRRKHTARRKRPKRQRGGLDEQTRQLVSLNIEQREANLGKMLQVACKNAGTCLALGNYDLYVKGFFEEFRNFDYLDKKQIWRIGSPSNNGFVLELTFVRDGYKACAVLKCAARAEADSLFYEYLVGRAFLNTHIKTLPNFLETYDLFEFNSETDYLQIADYAKHNMLYRDKVNLPSRITRIDTDAWRTLEQLKQSVGDSCVKNKLLCMTIQHFDKFYPMTSMFKSVEAFQSFRPDLMNVLFQVYFALNMLGSNYTHYDLHCNNVMLYKPFEGRKCILMRYHMKNNTFTFKTEYIAKIIDYGRNYFNRGKLNTTMLVREAVCQLSECQPDCGHRVGYQVIQGSAQGEDNVKYWIDPTRPNMSHDLRLAHIVLNGFVKDPTQALPKVVYQTAYGTPENNTEDPSKIYNIRQMFFALARNLPAYNTQHASTKYDATWQVVATMDVYSNGRDYEFNVLPDFVPGKRP